MVEKKPCCTFGKYIDLATVLQTLPMKKVKYNDDAAIGLHGRLAKHDTHWTVMDLWKWEGLGVAMSLSKVADNTY